MEKSCKSILEKSLGEELPLAYVRFIQNSPEAEINAAKFESAGNEWAFEVEGGMTCVDFFFSFSDDPNDSNSVLSYFKARIPGLPEKVIPIARDPGDWLICLDMRDHSGAVVIFDPDSGRVYFVTESFEKFLSNLKN